MPQASIQAHKKEARYEEFHDKEQLLHSQRSRFSSVM